MVLLVQKQLDPMISGASLRRQTVVAAPAVIFWSSRQANLFSTSRSQMVRHISALFLDRLPPGACSLCCKVQRLQKKLPPLTSGAFKSTCKIPARGFKCQHARSSSRQLEMFLATTSQLIA